MEITQLFGTVITIFITVYIAFILTQQFCETTPSFCPYSLIVFGALMFGVVVFLKYALFPSRG